MSSLGLEAELRELERVTAGALKAVAGFAPVIVIFGSDAVDGSDHQVVRLAPPKTPLSAIEVAAYRGAADAEALQLRHHDAAVHARIRPESMGRQAVYDRLAWFRALALGSRDLSGVCSNLTISLERRYRDSGYGSAGQEPVVPPADAIGLMLFAAIAQRSASGFLNDLVAPWRGLILDAAGPAFDKTVMAAPEQESFAAACCELLLAIEAVIAGHRPAPSHREAPSPSVVTQAAIQSPLSLYLSRLSTLPFTLPFKPRRQSQPASADRSANRLEKRHAAGQPGPGVDSPKASTEGPERYHVYSAACDQENRASDLADARERAALWQRLNRELLPLRSMVSRLANRLQRRLLAKQRRSWELGLEEGMLDPGRLSRVLTDPADHRLFRQPRDSAFKNTVVTLLLDNSGSMRGDAIVTTAICADVLAQVMERCAIRVEILGFTTTHWDGGPLRERWLAAGRPRSPGRLNALRHIVYKAVDTPWRRARQDIAVMLKPDLGKENIDGEALLWAQRRLLVRREERKILMVISDGSPRDESTQQANGNSYLDDHLRLVIKQIETYTSIHLLAIGIQHDVTRYYRHAISIRHHQELAGTMLNELEDLFARPVRRAGIHPGRGRAQDGVQTSRSSVRGIR